MNNYDKGRWEVLLIASNAEYGKQCYFLQDDGAIYSRNCGKNLTLDEAIVEFADRLQDM